MRQKLLALLLAASVVTMNVMPVMAAEVESDVQEQTDVSGPTTGPGGQPMGPSADENGFVVENGVLTKYVGTATEVVIPESVTSIGDRAFFSCENITSVTIPSGVTSIGTSAFWFCNSLTSIEIPEGVVSIGESAFYHCSSLAGVTIPGSVTSIGSMAFTDCDALKQIEVSSNNPSYTSYDGCLYNKAKTELISCPPGNGKTSIDVPDGVTSIAEYAFCGHKSLTSVKLPNGATSIGDFAFLRCFELKSITIPGSVTSIGSRAFLAGDKELIPVTIYGVGGSYAQEYASDYGIPFEAVEGSTETPGTSDGTAQDNTSTSVSASLKDPNGVLPEGVGIAPVTNITSGTVYDNAAAAAKAKIRGLGAFAVLDISLTDASIHELSGYVEVTIPVPGNLTVGNGKTIAVYRLEEDGTTLTRCESSVANGMITFKTNHFSTYIVANVPASPKMGETSNNMNVVFLIALMAGIGAVVVVKRKRI